MVQHQCNKCNKIFIRKEHYDRHILRTTPCDTLINLKINKKTHDKKDIFTCVFCKHTFTIKYNLSKHIKHNCKEIKRQEQIKQEIFDRLKEKNNLSNKKLQNKIAKLDYNIQIGNSRSYNTTNSHNNTTQNITNNITLIGYGKEDIRKLSDKNIKKILNRGYMSCIELTDQLHFNPKYPEYHNVYISNMKDKYAMMYNGTEWKLIGKTELVNTIYDDKKEFIEENIKEFCESLSGSKKIAIYDWLQMDEDDYKIKEIKEEIKLLLYNKKHIPIKSKELNL
jgi:hypothetical protein